MSFGSIKHVIKKRTSGRLTTSSHASIHRKLSQPWTLKFSSLYYVLGWIYPVATCIFIKLRQYKDLYSSQVLWQNSLWDKHQQKFLLFFFFLSFCSNDLFLWHYLEKPGKASIKSSESVIQATLITIRWTAPADDGGSPITGYRMILQKGETEIEKDDITDPGTTSYSFRGLEKNTNYTVKLFSRNFVFEGDPTVRTIKTKFEGEESQVIS